MSADNLRCTFGPILVEDRESADGRWAYRAGCLEHPEWDPGWNDPQDFDDTPFTSDAQAAREHTMAQAEDHLADDHTDAEAMSIRLPDAVPLA